MGMAQQMLEKVIAVADALKLEGELLAVQIRAEFAQLHSIARHPHDVPNPVGLPVQQRIVQRTRLMIEFHHGPADGTAARQRRMADPVEPAAKQGLQLLFARRLRPRRQDHLRLDPVDGRIQHGQLQCFLGTEMGEQPAFGHAKPTSQRADGQSAETLDAGNIQAFVENGGAGLFALAGGFGGILHGDVSVNGSKFPINLVRTFVIFKSGNQCRRKEHGEKSRQSVKSFKTTENYNHPADQPTSRIWNKMIDFLQTAFSFPVLFFTLLLGLVALYWCGVILGALDMDLLDFGGGGDLAEGSGHLLASVLAGLGLTGVPATVVLSFLTLWSWLLLFSASDFLLPLIPPGWLRTLAAVAAVLVSMTAALPLTALTIRPLRRLFVSHTAPAKQTMIGKFCRISTQRVDARFGQALYDDGGAGLIIAVRSAKTHTMAKDTPALITGYDRSNDVFEVIPVNDALSQSDLSADKTK